MGKKDISLLKYFENRERFADLLNGILFNGRQVLIPTELESEVSSFIMKDSENRKTVRNRDMIMKTKMGSAFAVWGIENQSEVDYRMPVRIMEYDAAVYRKQLQQLALIHGEKKDLGTNAEYLSRMKAEEKIAPVFTIVLYYGKEPWKGNGSLLDMVNLPNEYEEELGTYFQNYTINLFWVYEMDHVDRFRTGIRELFRILPYKDDKERMKQFIFEHEEYKNLDEDTYEVIADLLHESHLLQKKRENKETGGADMCKAIQDWIAEEREAGIEHGRELGMQQGYEQGENSFARLSEILVKRGKTEQLLMAVSDKMLRNELYIEYKIR